MPRLTESRRNARREQIAAAALRCFLSNGFADTSMADIIKESGLSAGSIYSHFDSKADLMRFVAAEVLESRKTGLAAEATPGDFVRNMLRPLDGEHARLLLQSWAEALRNPEIASLVHDQVGTLRDAIEARLLRRTDSRTLPPGQDAGQAAAAAADAVLSAMHGYIVRIALDPDVDPGVLIAGIAAMVDRADPAVAT